MGLTRARIALDAMGGDRAPKEIVAGAIESFQRMDVEVLLVGDPQQIEPFLSAKADNIRIVPADGIVDMHEEPLTALRRKPRASVNVATSLVKEGEADAVVSAGHSGAAMAAALLRLGRLPGVDRPAIGAVLPTLVSGKSVLILDVGANVDCRPKFLEQFALMGTIYSQSVLGVDDPRVGLLNIGEEPSKGNDAAVRTHQLLEDNPKIPFVGNAEGRDVLTGDFDVIVCDGFVGNILLKFAEAVGDVMLQVCQDELLKGFDGDTLEPYFQRVRSRIDRVEHGGGLLLGVDGVAIIAHGSSRGPAIANAIRLAKTAIDNRVLERLHENYRQAQHVG